MDWYTPIDPPQKPGVRTKTNFLKGEHPGIPEAILDNPKPMPIPKPTQVND